MGTENRVPCPVLELPMSGLGTESRVSCPVRELPRPRVGTKNRASCSVWELPSPAMGIEQVSSSGQSPRWAHLGTGGTRSPPVTGKRLIVRRHNDGQRRPMPLITADSDRRLLPSVCGRDGDRLLTLQARIQTTGIYRELTGRARYFHCSAHNNIHFTN